MINLALLKRLWWRFLTSKNAYQDLCAKQWIISPAERSVIPPAIFADGELDKVTGVQEETSYTHELQRIQGGIMEHVATIAYQLNDTQINNGYVYKKGMRIPLTTNKESLFVSNKLERYSEAALACTFTGNRYFGHWLTDDLTLTLACRQLSQAVRTNQKYTDHQSEYSKILDIQSTCVSNARFKKLIMIQDFGQNSYKRERYEYIRSRLKALCTPETKSGAKLGVMLLRGNSGVKRSLINENKIAEFLKSQGFKIIDPEQKSAYEIARQTSQAKIVIGVEGSHLVHGLFTLREDGAMLTLQSPCRFNNVFKGYTDCLNLKYSFVVGRHVGNGFEIDIADLAKTLDLLNL